MDYNNSPNMALPIPTVSVASGPDWATLLDSCLTIVDAHTHAPGSGVPITPDALSITSDLPMGSNNLTLARSIKFDPQITPIALPADVGCLSVAGVDLYYRDVSGNSIRLTQSGSIVGTAGSIGGLPSGTASANYSAGTYVWQSATAIAANMDFGAAVMRNTSPNSTFALTLKPPSSMGSNTTVTLPTLPASNAPLIMSSAGVITASVASQQAFCPTGVMLPYAGSSIPTGWLSCNGSAVSRSTFSALFSAIGTAFGVGDGSTTFNIPDMRRQVPMGAGGTQISGGAPATTVGSQGGSEAHTQSISEMPSHNHGGVTQADSPDHSHTPDGQEYPVTVGGAQLVYGTSTGTPNIPVTGGRNQLHNHVIDFQGGGAAMNLVQPSLVVNYIIKT